MQFSAVQLQYGVVIMQWGVNKETQLNRADRIMFPEKG